MIINITLTFRLRQCVHADLRLPADLTFDVGEAGLAESARTQSGGDPVSGPMRIDARDADGESWYAEVPYISCTQNAQ